MVQLPGMWMKCPDLFSVQAVILCRHFFLGQNSVFYVGPVTNLIYFFSVRFHKTDTESHLTERKRKRRRRKRRKMRLNNYLHCLRYLLFIQHYFFVQNYFWNKKLQYVMHWNGHLMNYAIRYNTIFLCRTVSGNSWNISSIEMVISWSMPFGIIFYKTISGKKLHVMHRNGRLMNYDIIRVPYHFFLPVLEREKS